MIHAAILEWHWLHDGFILGTCAYLFMFSILVVNARSMFVDSQADAPDVLCLRPGMGETTVP